MQIVIQYERCYKRNSQNVLSNGGNVIKTRDEEGLRTTSMSANQPDSEFHQDSRICHQDSRIR